MSGDATPGTVAAADERVSIIPPASMTLQNELAAFSARELIASAEPVAAAKLVARAVDADASLLKALAAAVTSQPGLIAVLVSTASPALVVVARSADVAASAQHILAALVARFGGKGGGRPELAQGGGLAGSATAILDAARAHIG